MRSLRRLLTRLANSAGRRAEDDRMREEIEEHLALLTAEHLRAGLSPAEARRQALLDFGGVEATTTGLPGRAEAAGPRAPGAGRPLRAPHVAQVARLHCGGRGDAGPRHQRQRRGLRPHGRPRPAPPECARTRRASGAPGTASIPASSRIPTIATSAIATAPSTIWPPFRSPSSVLTRARIPPLASGFATTGNYFDVLRIQPQLGRFFHALR